MTPLIIDRSLKAVLVNRGWVPLNQDRSNLPDINIINEQVVIKGRINYFPSVGIKLAGAEIPTAGWPSVLQVIDVSVLSEKLGYSIAAFQVELDKELPEGFKRDWQVTAIMLPEQHVAYAVQWFALAATLTVLFFWYSIKRSKDE
jgi:surfeit locus 1 family protein